MTLQPLTAISPVDGRYYTQLEPLSAYFSEYALIRYRVRIEVEYFIALAAEGLFNLPDESAAKLRNLYTGFSLEDASWVKKAEAKTNHDVKAVEYFVKEKLPQLGLEAEKEWVHFGLTSQDINNTAVPLLWKEAMQAIYLPGADALLKALQESGARWTGVPMLARTHGQPASPTTMGKEWLVFAERLERQLEQLKQIPFTAKFGGATGNFNAHHVAFPDRDWPGFADRFVEGLGLRRLRYTTQIDHYDNLAAQFDAMKRIGTILIDFCRDVWTYVSLDYFTQQVKKGEVGSSAMPHKVNPIDFENAEGNLGLAGALFEHLSAKLPISRLQRDLTDSTVLRNIGVPFAHGVLAFRSIDKGLSKLILNEGRLSEDLDRNWAVVAEAIQTILRRERYPEPYEALKALTRGQGAITRETIHAFIDSLEVSAAVKAELKRITPHNYRGTLG